MSSTTTLSTAPISRGLVCAAVMALAASLLFARTAVAEDLGSPGYPPEIAGAVALLADVPSTGHLPGVLQKHGVTVRFVPMAENVFARYSVAGQTILVDARWRDADPSTLAAVIAHEAVHAQDAVNGFLASGGATACIESEIRAFTTSAELWLHLHGATGKAEPLTDLERQLNLIADRYQRDPEGLEQLIRQAYTDQCYAHEHE